MTTKVIDGDVRDSGDQIQSGLILFLPPAPSNNHLWIIRRESVSVSFQQLKSPLSVGTLRFDKNRALGRKRLD